MAEQDGHNEGHAGERREKHKVAWHRAGPAPLPRPVPLMCCIPHTAATPQALCTVPPCDVL